MRILSPPSRAARGPRTGLRARAAVALLLAASTGCRTYTVLPSHSLDPGRTVRVRLTATGSGDVASAIGPHGSVLEGALVSRDDSTLTLAPTRIVRVSGDEERWPGDAVVVRRTAVLGVDAVRVSTHRSLLLAGGMLAALAVVRAAIGGGDQVSRMPGGEGSTPR